MLWKWYPKVATFKQLKDQNHLNGTSSIFVGLVGWFISLPLSNRWCLPVFLACQFVLSSPKWSSSCFTSDHKASPVGSPSYWDGRDFLGQSWPGNCWSPPDRVIILIVMIEKRGDDDEPDCDDHCRVGEIITSKIWYVRQFLCFLSLTMSILVLNLIDEVTGL